MNKTTKLYKKIIKELQNNADFTNKFKKKILKIFGKICRSVIKIKKVYEISWIN